MAKKLDTTPDGIICDTCGQDLPPYHFFNPRGKFDRSFWTRPVLTGKTCFACAGDYKCVQCQQVQPASEYRVQGRICRTCKTAPARIVASVENALDS